MRHLAFLCLVLLLVAGCSRQESVQANRKPDLVFRGTVESIQGDPLPQSLANWIVRFRVEEVLLGDFGGKTFAFRIHSPAMSGLEVGKQYTVEAIRTVDGYSVDQDQWWLRADH